MENGDSDTDKYPHRTGNIAGSDELYGIASPLPLSKKGRGFLLIDSGSGAFGTMFA
jgi:hypothetical protein